MSDGGSQTVQTDIVGAGCVYRVPLDPDPFGRRIHDGPWTLQKIAVSAPDGWLIQSAMIGTVEMFPCPMIAEAFRDCDDVDAIEDDWAVPEGHTVELVLLNESSTPGTARVTLYWRPGLPVAPAVVGPTRTRTRVLQLQSPGRVGTGCDVELRWDPPASEQKLPARIYRASRLLVLDGGGWSVTLLSHNGRVAGLRPGERPNIVELDGVPIDLRFPLVFTARNRGESRQFNGAVFLDFFDVDLSADLDEEKAAERMGAYFEEHSPLKPDEARAVLDQARAMIAAATKPGGSDGH